MPVALSTGKRQKQASRVFGDVVFHEADDTSLSYSPSPRAPLQQNPNILTDKVSSPLVLFETNGPSLASKGKHVSFVQEDKENSGGNINVSNSPVVGKSSVDSFRSAELSRLRASFQSPQRRDLVKKTQLAINNATTSVNQSLNNKKSINPSLNAARKAKEEALKNRVKKTRSVRFQWEEEKKEAKSFYQKVEENRRQIIAVQRKLASAHFKQKANRDNEKKFERFSKLEQDYTFNSEVYREHQQKQKDERDRNRKKSIETRAKLRQNKRRGENKLKKIKEEEEAANFEVRYDLHKSRNETSRSNAEDRRKSFQFRAGDARRIRNIRSQWREDTLQKKHESYELSRAAAKDVEAYKKKMEEDRRQSLRFRNQEARNIREKSQRQKASTMQAEHESYELKWAGEKDAEEYKRKMQEERRMSLAGRNKDSVRHAQVMQELKSLAQEEQAESFMLKWAGEKDAEAYIAQMAEERRKSLHFRGEEAKRHRLLEEDEHEKRVQSAIAEGLLQSECQQDVENYKKECEERRRKSLQYRAKEKRLQTLEENNQKVKEQEYEHKMFELETQARSDVKMYIEDCKRSRRKSLAFRAKEKRRHAKWKQQQREKELRGRSHTSHLRSLDAQHFAFSQQQERARMAMDALRSAGCTIKGNPFDDLMNL